VNAQPDPMRVTVGYDYVLVIEWLNVDEPRLTGTELHERLQAADVPTQLCVCNTGDDVRRALADAHRQIRIQGVPAIQLETHGTNPFEGNAVDIAFGARRELVRWSTLGEWLARLNAASGYQLLMVSAACWGSAVMAAMGGGEHPAAFAAAIGFRTRVTASRLFDAMVELYRSLRRGESILESVNGAQRELEVGQQLELEMAVLVAARILAGALRQPLRRFRNAPLEPAQRIQILRRPWDTWFPLALQERQPAYRFENILPMSSWA
jgi:hypothetical protein